MFGPKQIILRQPYWRFLQERALKNGTTPLDELDRVFEWAMNPTAAYPLPEPTPPLALAPAPAPAPARPKMTPAERMAWARSHRKIEQHG